MDTAGIKSFFQKPEFGLLCIRLTVGAILLVQGINKFIAGESTLRSVGYAVRHTGIPVSSDSIFTLLLGGIAAGTEVIGGLLLIVGYFFRPAAALLFITMVVATISTYQTTGGDFMRYFAALTFAGVTFGLLWTGPGRISIQKD